METDNEERIKRCITVHLRHQFREADTRPISFYEQKVLLRASLRLALPLPEYNITESNADTVEVTAFGAHGHVISLVHAGFQFSRIPEMGQCQRNHVIQPYGWACSAALLTGGLVERVSVSLLLRITPGVFTERPNPCT